jgi:hypothetical protein
MFPYCSWSSRVQQGSARRKVQDGLPDNFLIKTGETGVDQGGLGPCLNTVPGT